VSSSSDYWDRARAGGATIVVDAPALERSTIALRVAPHMDGVVLVVGADEGAAPAALAARAALASGGANLIGLVYAGDAGPARAIERLLRQAV
jgi:Mrp family chromosome partitioning ATPase